MVMLGALIGSGTTGVDADTMKKAIAAFTKEAFLESNLKAFELGMESTAQ